MSSWLLHKERTQTVHKAAVPVLLPHLQTGTPHPQPHSGRAVWGALCQPQLPSATAKSLAEPVFSWYHGKNPWGGGLAAPSSISARPGITWAIPGRGDSEAGNTSLPWTTAYRLLPLPSSPFLPPFPQGPNSQLCCSINIITIIILSLDT